MINPDYLRGIFRESTCLALGDIFYQANNTTSADTLLELQDDLVSILQKERSYKRFRWEISPSGHNHIIIIDCFCFLFNVLGFQDLFKDAYSWQISEGDISIRDFQWIEDDNLVIFNIVDIPEEEWQRCICHFKQNNMQENSFVFFSSFQKGTFPEKMDFEETSEDRVVEDKTSDDSILDIGRLLDEW